MSMHDLTESLGRTWESVSQGWKHLISRAGNALTHFGKSGQKEDNIPVRSPRWGLLSVDLFDDADKLVVKLEVPGLSAADFDISVVDNILSISGEKHFERQESKGEYRLLECAYGRFTRSIPLGYEVDENSARATYEQGVLKVELEKQAHQRRRHIKVS